MNASDMLERLTALDDAGLGESLEAISLRDQLHEAADRAFRAVIAPSFQRADGTLPEWVNGKRTELSAPWTEPSPLRPDDRE